MKQLQPARAQDYTIMCCVAPSEFLVTVALENRDTLLAQRSGHRLKKISGVLSGLPKNLLICKPSRLQNSVESATFCNLGKAINSRGFGVLPELFAEADTGIPAITVHLLPLPLGDF